MLLTIITMDKKGNFRPFSCQTHELEAAFEILTSIAASGDVVISIDLIDNGQHTALPPEAFDGKPIRPHIEKLESEWKALLNKPVSLQSVYQLLTAITSQIRENNQARIDRLEKVIRQTESNIVQVRRKGHWESGYVRLEMQLTKYLLQLKRAQAGRRRIYERFGSYWDSE